MHDARNEPTSEKTSSRSHTIVPPTPRAIGDDYTEYVRETFGYQYDALDLLTPAQKRRHDRLRASDKEALTTMDATDGQGDLERLGIAHAMLANDMEDRATEVLCAIAATTQDFHACVAYDEVLEQTCLSLVSRGDASRADDLWSGQTALTEQMPRAELIRGVWLWMLGEADDATQHLEAYVAQREEETAPDLERYYDVAEALWQRAMAASAARAWAHRGLKEAEAAGYRALVTDLRLFLANLPPQDAEGEEE